MAPEIPQKNSPNKPEAQRGSLSNESISKYLLDNYKINLDQYKNSEIKQKFIEEIQNLYFIQLEQFELN